LLFEHLERCDYANPQTARFCLRRGTPLTEEKIIKIASREAEMEELRRDIEDTKRALRELAEAPRKA